MGEADKGIQASFQQMNEFVRQVRNIRAEMQLPPSEKTELSFSAPQKIGKRSRRTRIFYWG